MTDYSMYVPDVHFEQIPIKNLVSSQDYQRSLSQRHVEHTAENFNLRLINPVKVSRRDGVNYVFDGQHTIETVARVSGSRDTPVWCMIYDDLDYQEEADIFANQTKYVKPLRPYEIFVANIEAQNDKQLIIKDLVESYSLKVGSTRDYCTVCAVGTLERIYDKFGFHVLDRTLRLCVAAWEGDMHSLSANFLSGVARLIYAFGDSLRDEFFKERIGFISVKQLARTAKERRPGSLGYAEAMLVAYNRKCKYPLSWNKLYDKNAMGGEDLDSSTEVSGENPNGVESEESNLFERVAI